MRKIFVLFLMLVFGFFSFAETGYKGCHWRHSLERCSKIVQLEPYVFKEGTIEPDIFDDMLEQGYSKMVRKNKTVILGKQNTVLYFFLGINNNYYLSSVSYIVSTDQIKEITNKLTAVRKYKTSKQITNPNSLVKEDVLDLLSFSLNESEQKHLSQEIVDIYVQILFSEISFGYVTKGEDSAAFNYHGFTSAEKKNKNVSGTLYIYDYNEDTRMYVFDNIIKDKAVVVYVPHEQDY